MENDQMTSMSVMHSQKNDQKRNEKLTFAVIDQAKNKII